MEVGREVVMAMGRGRVVVGWGRMMGVDMGMLCKASNLDAGVRVVVVVAFSQGLLFNKV